MDNSFEIMDIVLDGSKTRFQSGEELSGHIRLELKGASIVGKIKIDLICAAEVKWMEDPGTRHYRDGYVYHQKVILFDQTYILPKRYEHLLEGEHEVPFRFKLPEKGIPSTFDGPHGSIKYFIEVVNEELGVDYGQRIAFNEFRVDAPIVDNLNLSIGSSKEKEFTFPSLVSGKTTLHASLSKKGWVPGEAIELHVTVENQTTTETAPRATLYQTQIYMCGERHKAIEIPLIDPIVGKKVAKNVSFTETLFIPTTKDLSFNIKSPLISVKYFLHVTLDIPNEFDINVNVPVVMTSLAITE